MRQDGFNRAVHVFMDGGIGKAHYCEALRFEVTCARQVPGGAPIGVMLTAVGFDN